MRTILLALMTSVLLSHAHADGGGLGGAATEATQLANNTELIMSYAEQAKHTVTLINQYNTMLQNLQRMTPGPLTGPALKKLWNDQNMDETFRDLYRLTNNGQRVAYTLQTMDEAFRRLHPGYGNYAKHDFPGAYRTWSENNRNSTMAALRASTIQADDIQSERDLIEELNGKSESSAGQLQALQAGNQIGLSLVTQLQKLRQLQLSQIQAQNTVSLSEQGRRESEEEILLRRYYGASGVRPKPVRENKSK